MVLSASTLFIIGGGIAILALAVALVLLSILVPRAGGTDAEQVIRDIALSEQLFSALSSIGKPVVFEVSVHSIGEEIHFYLSVPRESERFAGDQVRGLYP